MTIANVYFRDAFLGLEDLKNNTIDSIITDPPYFLDGMEDTWEEEMIETKTTKSQTISSLRSGMKFDKQQGIDFENFMNRIAKIAIDKLKPGGWFVSFSSPRLYHRLAVGVEDAGFEIRDMWEWLYTQNQMKAMSVMRQFESDEELSKFSKKELKKLSESLLKWKTPQVRSCFEPIVLAQKPREGTFYNNWKNYGIGLINVEGNVGKDNLSTSNVMTTESINEILDRAFLINKPKKKEKGKTTHLSVKPLELMKHIIEVLVPEGGIIVDPFNGSGSTGIASLLSKVNFIGFENNKKYFLESFERNNDYFKAEFNSDHESYTVNSNKHHRTLF